jgi:hypothetical protein
VFWPTHSSEDGDSTRRMTAVTLVASRVSADRISGRLLLCKLMEIQTFLVSRVSFLQLVPSRWFWIYNITEGNRCYGLKKIGVGNG